MYGKDPELMKHIPKRKWEAVEQAWQDDDGMWIWLKEGWWASNMLDKGTRCIHEDELHHLKYQIKGIVKVDDLSESTKSIKCPVKESTGRYIDIQNEIIAKYNINVVVNSTCWSRTHAHVKERKVCKWKQANSIASTFTLFHEIGHIETTKSKMRRCESEYYATVWAMDRCKEYNLEVPDKIIQDYQDYIDCERDRGLRRGGQNLPVFNLKELKVEISEKVTEKQNKAKSGCKWRVGFKRSSKWVYQVFSDHQIMIEEVSKNISVCEKISINLTKEKFSLS